MYLGISFASGWVMVLTMARERGQELSNDVALTV